MENEDLKRKPIKRKKSSLWLHKPKRRKLHEEDNGVQIETDTPINKTSTHQHFRVTSSCLRRAPVKKSKQKHTTASKKLFDSSKIEQEIDSISDIIPAVLNKLKSAGLFTDFCVLLKTINSGKFPLTNIALRLVLDVARWYSLESTTMMSYPAESVKFWKILYRLFHGKCLRFMSGARSTGQVVEGTTHKGLYDPKLTEINFAVPDVKTVNNYFEIIESKFPREIPPGIIKEVSNFIDKKRKYVLSVDGKKIATGLTSEYGDQDLFGHEDSDTLQSLKDRLDKEIAEVDAAKDQWDNLSMNERRSCITHIVQIVSVRIKDLRILYQRQKLSLKKFYKEAGDDWRKSKYVFAISSIQSMIFQIKALVTRLLSTNDALLMEGASLSGTTNSFAGGSSVDSFSQPNWISLKEPTDLPENLTHETRLIKQRSEDWFQLRKTVRLTGSTIFEGIGLDTLKNQLKHYDKVVKGRDDHEEFSEEVKKRLEHGTTSEIHAIATLTSKVLPFFFPDLQYIEEGCLPINNGVKPCMLISPDGSLGQIDLNNPEVLPIPQLACEFKCPIETDYKPPVHYEIPLRYIPQILSEMACMKVDRLLYLSWSEESSVVIEANFDNELWDKIFQESISLYGEETPKRPTRLSQGSKDIKIKMAQYRTDSTRFLCEVRSVKGTSFDMSQSQDSSPYIFPVSRLCVSTKVDVNAVFGDTISAIKETYQLCRKKASEVLVWLLSDTDRLWHPEIPHSLPISYAMKGYSLSTKTMRAMHDDILQHCHDNQIQVTCSCFDGQWMKLANRDDKDRPLTLLQLQKDVWDEAGKQNRDSIISSFTKTPIVRDVEKDLLVREKEGCISVSCPLYYKLTSCISKGVQQKDANQVHVVETENTSADDTLSCLPDEALDALIDEQDIATDLIPGIVHVSSPDIPNKEREVPVENNDETSNRDHERVEMSDELYKAILRELKDHKNPSVRKKWATKSHDDLKTATSEIKTLKALTHDEMNVIISLTIDLQKRKGIVVKKTWRAQDKSNALSLLIGSGEQIEEERFVKHMMTLKDIAASKIRSSTKINSHNLPKNKLNVLYATLIYPELYDRWVSQSPFSDDLQIDGVASTTLFSHPGFNDKRQKYEPMCVDAHHLLVNLRVKVCKDGLTGIKKEAWHKVAEDRNIISKALVVDLIDKQNNGFALRTFSKQVEDRMEELGYKDEAEFCNIVREWYEAEDLPGISAEDRICRRLRMKAFLLRNIDFGIFPPFGMYINGFTRASFEGFLQKIDTNIQLYALSGTYNQRSVSSLANETFFGELSEMEATKLGCPKAISIPRLISTVTEILHYRCEPSERTFSMSTTRKSVYPVHRLQCSDPQEDSSMEIQAYEQGQIRTIKLRDHFFDTQLRKRRKQRVSKKSDISKPHEVSRGCLPIRQHHKTDESKILPTTRLGIDLKSLCDV